MRPKATVNCAACNKEFLKTLHHIKENLKLGHRFFCSLYCQSVLKSNRSTLTCSNPGCGKLIIRTPSEISENNFCSQSCAAIVNNQKYPKRKPNYRTCSNLDCQNVFKGRKKFCSISCWPFQGSLPPPHWGYSKEQLIDKIQTLTEQLGRVPTRRECPQSSSCQKHFGSWNNAVIAAGLIPHRSKSQRMFKRIETFAKDGHYCYSISELLIDNWLTDQGIPHNKEVSYPEKNYLTDWQISNKKIFIEYFGLANDVENYDITIEKKKAICQRYGIKLVDLYAKDLYPIRNLDTKIPKYDRLLKLS